MRWLRCLVSSLLWSVPLFLLFNAFSCCVWNCSGEVVKLNESLKAQQNASAKQGPRGNGDQT